MPFLAARVAVLSRHMGCALTTEEILEDFKTFYFDTALSSHETTLAAMENFITPDRLLFGTDFPGAYVRINVYCAIAEFYTLQRLVLRWLVGLQTTWTITVSVTRQKRQSCSRMRWILCRDSVNDFKALRDAVKRY